MSQRLLDRIDSPSDLRTLTREELAQVAQEARDAIISVITERGGHLASNLGVVELTLALHRVFESPTDSLVWDTTNQLYTHKLVTGRRDEFQNIRLEGGLSGFGEPTESPHDTLCAGHAGTGLSIALGIAQGAANRRLDSWTIAIVGDGAMTSGSSFEALNNIAKPSAGMRTQVNRVTSVVLMSPLLSSRLLSLHPCVISSRLRELYRRRDTWCEPDLNAAFGRRFAWA